MFLFQRTQEQRRIIIEAKQALTFLGTDSFTDGFEEVKVLVL